MFEHIIKETHRRPGGKCKQENQVASFLFERTHQKAHKKEKNQAQYYH